jgi:hypothetical protein
MIDAAEAVEADGLGSASRSARYRLIADCNIDDRAGLPRRMRFRGQKTPMRRRSDSHRLLVNPGYNGRPITIR